MPQFVVLLRGVNVGKANRVPMAAFKTLLHELGATDVSTLLNSGNAVFRSAGRSPARHAEQIAQALQAHLGVTTPVVVKTAADFQAAVAGNPIAVPDDQHAQFLVAYANDSATLQNLAPLQALAQPPEQLALGPHAGYLHCAAGLLASPVAAAMLGKAYRTVTTRNWATTLKLLALLEPGPQAEPLDLRPAPPQRRSESPP